jgi:hypothetical protein
MAFRHVDSAIGMQPVAETSTTQKHPLGMISRGIDPDYGMGEFIYLVGIGSTVVGSVVTYGPSTYVTTLIASTANMAQPVAVAMSANVASQYGWYQIEGIAVAKKTNVSWEPDKVVYISGSSGRVMDTAASGKQILNARSANVATVTTTTSTVLLRINRPCCQGQVI